MLAIRRLPSTVLTNKASLFITRGVRLSSSSTANIKIPFDDQPFPFSRFEPCCPDSEAKQYENGYVPCKQHPMPNVIGSKVEFLDQLPTRAPNTRHLVVCVGPEGSEWSRSKVETVKGGLVLEMESAKNDWLRHHRSTASSSTKEQQQQQQTDMLVTVCDKSPVNSSTADVLMFPDFRKFTSIDPSHLKDSSFMNVLQTLWKDSATPDLPEGSQSMDDVDTVILVCTHTMRDKRCGVLGPLIVQEFERVLKEKGLDNKVQVYGASHFGGKKTKFLVCQVWYSNHKGGGDSLY